MTTRYLAAYLMNYAERGQVYDVDDRYYGVADTVAAALDNWQDAVETTGPLLGTGGGGFAVWAIPPNHTNIVRTLMEDTPDSVIERSGGIGSPFTVHPWGTDLPLLDINYDIDQEN